MRSSKQAERELYPEIDRLVAKLGKECSSALSEKERIERYIRDADLRDEIIAFLVRLVEIRKRAEMEEDQGKRCVRYSGYFSITPRRLSFAGPVKVL